MGVDIAITPVGIINLSYNYHYKYLKNLKEIYKRFLKEESWNYQETIRWLVEELYKLFYLGIWLWKSEFKLTTRERGMLRMITCR